MPQKRPGDDPRWRKVRALIARRNRLNQRIRAAYDDIRNIDTQIAELRQALRKWYKLRPPNP